MMKVELAATRRANAGTLLAAVAAALACAGCGTTEEVVKTAVDTPAPAATSAGPSVAMQDATPSDTRSLARASRAPRSYAPGDTCNLAISRDRPPRLTQYGGKIVVLDFWATYCEPCKKSFPKLESLNQKYRGAGVVILGVSEDDESDEIADFVEVSGARFQTCWDKGHTVAVAYSPSTMPTIYVLDKTGTVRFTDNGYHDGEEVALETQIRQLIAER